MLLTAPAMFKLTESFSVNVPCVVVVPSLAMVLEGLFRLTEVALPDRVPSTSSNWLWVSPPVIVSVTSPLLFNPLVDTPPCDSDPIDSVWLSVNITVPVPVTSPAEPAPAKKLT